MAMLKVSKVKIERRLAGTKFELPDCSSQKLVRSRETREAMQKVVELDPDFSYDHVIGLHGDQMKHSQYSGNDNGDFFWWKQTLLVQRKDGMFAYETWRQGDVLENHDENSVRGHIADVWPVFEDKSIDMLMATSRKQYPMLVKNIDAGRVTDVSMGTIVGHSYCSNPKCHRHASKKNPNITEDDWCGCLKYRKGQFDPDAGCWIYEDNRDIYGVECSWITFGQGADSDAKQQMRVASLTHQQLKTGQLPLRDRGVVQLFSDRGREAR